MNMQVVREDGRTETITIREPVAVVHGNDLDRLVSADAEHFFTKSGFYDGWGCATRLDESEAGRLIETLEAGRRIEEG